MKTARELHELVKKGVAPKSSLGSQGQ